MATKQSPREENGIVYWYVNNTFTWTFSISLTDINETPLDITGDTVTVVFANGFDKIIHTFTDTVENGTISIRFDETITAKFGKGMYSYRVNITHSDTRTITADGQAYVE